MSDRIFVDGKEIKRPDDIVSDDILFGTPEVLFQDCNYLHEEKDSEYAPTFGVCQFCYRYDICFKYYCQQAAAARGAARCYENAKGS